MHNRASAHRCRWALSFLLIKKKQKIKACILSCKKLQKSQLRQSIGSFLTSLPPHSLNTALTYGSIGETAKIFVLFPTKICQAAQQSAVMPLSTLHHKRLKCPQVTQVIRIILGKTFNGKLGLHMRLFLRKHQ
ncbi:hypothetical protein QFZ20_003463 [Flavobacterium sp. W4I14]|nr:hypothetical protein [Flavobacterium sp. W4I14]